MQDRSFGRPISRKDLNNKPLHLRQLHRQRASTSPLTKPTVGVDFVSKTINVENKSLRMQLWDTAGQERFHSLIPSYIKDSSAAIIVFDITSNTTTTYRRQFLQQPQQMDRQRQRSQRRRGTYHDLR